MCFFMMNYCFYYGGLGSCIPSDFEFVLFCCWLGEKLSWRALASWWSRKKQPKPVQRIIFPSETADTETIIFILEKLYMRDSWSIETYHATLIDVMPPKQFEAIHLILHGKVGLPQQKRQEREKDGKKKPKEKRNVQSSLIYLEFQDEGACHNPELFHRSLSPVLTKTSCQLIHRYHR